jgi:fatty acid desaturase
LTVRVGAGRPQQLPAYTGHGTALFYFAATIVWGNQMLSTGETAPSQSRPAAAGGWLHSLTPQQRAELAALHRPNAWTQAKPLILLVIWLVCAAVAVKVDSLFVRVLCWIVIGGTLHCFGAFVHDCSHLSVFRKPWLDRTLGFLCGLPVFFPSASYRATHQLHHKYLNTAKDPDALAANFADPRLRIAIFYGGLVIGAPVSVVILLVTGPFRARRASDKFACVIEPFLMLAFYTALFTFAGRYGFGHILADGWAWALPVAMLIGNFRGLAEHTQLAHGDPPDPLRVARTVETSPFVSFFLNNLNYHLEHHLYPGIPWNNLPKVHRLLSPVFAQGQAAVAGGYRRWMVQALRYGPNHTFSYRGLDAYLD